MFKQKLLQFLQPGRSTELSYEPAGKSQAFPAVGTGTFKRVGSSGQRKIMNEVAAG